MSFETGTATGIGDLLVKWFNFLQANGWTADVDWASSAQSPAYGVIHRQNQLSPEDENTVNLYCGFADGVVDGTDGPQMMMVPMRGYVSGDPVDAIEVATNGTTAVGTSNIETNFPTSPFENYWFFESDYYAHAVVEWATGHYRHFGMGSLNKIGKWYGGEYYYGTAWKQSVSLIDSGITNQHYCHLSGNIQGSTSSPQIYGQLSPGVAFPELQGRQSPESAWGGGSATPETGTGWGTDKDGRDRWSFHVNDMRLGFNFFLSGLGQVPFNGYRPMQAITVFATYGGITPDHVVPIGSMPDCRLISMQGALEGGDEFTVGADTWVAFPLVRKTDIDLSDNTEEGSWFGYAYKKVLT